MTNCSLQKPFKLWLLKQTYHIKHSLFVLVLLVFPSKFVYSQKPYFPEVADPLTEPWRWEHFPELIGKGLRCICESKDGIIWFGVDKGIMRYDGLNWNLYNIGNRAQDLSVNYICITKTQKIYAGTDDGIYLFSKNTWKKIFPEIKDSAANKIARINCMRVLNDDAIVAGVGTGNYTGLIVIRGDRQTLISSDEVVNRSVGKFKDMNLSALSNEITPDSKFEIEEIYEDNDQNIWISTRLNTAPFLLLKAKLQNKDKDLLIVTKIFGKEEGLKHGKHTIFKQTAEGNLWAINAEYQTGISIYNGKFWKNFKLSENVGDDEMHTSILQTHDKTIWIGGMGNLYALKDGKWKWYKKPDILISFSRINLFEDSKGFLWIFGKQSEVYRVDYAGYTWHTLKKLNYQCETHDGKKWFLSVDGRVVVNDKNDWYSYGPEDGLPDAPVRLFCASGDIIWATGSNKSIAATSWFNGKKWEMILHPNLSWGIDYRAVFEDKNRNLWFGCSVDISLEKGQMGGVLKLENGRTQNQQWTHYNPNETFHMHNAYGIGQSKDGTIWLGGSRLSSFDGKKWEQSDTAHSINTYYDYVTSLPGGNLWVGSRYYGIFSFDGARWKSYNVSTGMPSNTVIHILPLNDSSLIVATDNNICRFDGSGWIKSILPEQLNFSREGGDLKVSRDGTIWINRSLRMWKRRPLKGNNLTDVLIDNFFTVGYKPNNSPPNTDIVEYSKEVSRHGNTVISWSGKDYWHATSPDRLSFSYRLNGGKWTPFQEKSYETFIGLTSGNYTLEVRSRDLDLNIDKTPARVEFRVLPPIWKQIWFILLIISFIFIIGIFQYLAYKKSREIVSLYNSLKSAKLLLEEQKDQILEQIKTDRENYQQKIKFFTRISHEFRTPLTIITGAVDKISSTLDQTNNSKLAMYVLALSRNANHLLKLINQLMDFRKLESSSMELRVSKGNIIRYIESIFCNFSNLAQHYNIELELVSNFSGNDIWFDPDKIEKIVNNLVSNAIKFTPENGRVKISVLTKDSESYCIVIEDTGIGISDEEKDRIFEPFYQGKTAPVRKHEGTGIGLSMVKSLIELHHGTLYLKSKKCKSRNCDSNFVTSFTVELPLSKDKFDPSEIIEKEIDSEELEFSGLLDISEIEVEMLVQENIIQYNNAQTNSLPVILLVEDNEDLSQLIMESFKRQYSFLWAKNGAEGYTFAVESLPDLIISDILMPVLNGIEMCIKIKADNRISHIPLILLTAKVSEDNQVEGFEAGADDYITKPFSPPVLAARIKNLIDSRDVLRKKFRNELELHPIGKIIPIKEEDFIKKVMDVIESNINNPNFDVELLSREVGLSSRHLLNKIQNLTDYSPVEFIKIIRLKKAEQMLLSTKLTISEIAYDVGFSDPNYFSKCFQKQYGKTPKDFIASNH